VLSFPYPLWFQFASRLETLSRCLAVLLRAIETDLIQRADRSRVSGARTGAVTVVQRFGSALNLDTRGNPAGQLPDRHAARDFASRAGDNRVPRTDLVVCRQKNQREPMIRSLIYNTLMRGLTARWYAEVLERLPHGAAVLDVGIGTAGALLANAEQVTRKDLQITGIDIDADYGEHARHVLQHAGMSGRVRVSTESVYAHQGGPYDAVYFSASFMLLPEPECALRHCAELLLPGGRIYFTQTIQTRRSIWMETLKPLLKRATTIDFGRVTYEDDFRAQVRAAGMELDEFTHMGRSGPRAYCLAVAVPQRLASSGSGRS